MIYRILLYDNFKSRKKYYKKWKNDEKDYLNSSENEHVYLINK